MNRIGLGFIMLLPPQMFRTKPTMRQEHTETNQNPIKRTDLEMRNQAKATMSHTQDGEPSNRLQLTSRKTS